MMDVTTQPAENKKLEEIMETSKNIHKQVEEAMSRTNDLYKEKADRARRFQTFEGELVMVVVLTPN